MELRPDLRVADSVLAAFARRHGIARLALFGSVLRGDFDENSDVDILVEFEPGHTPGLFGLAAMERELEATIGRTVDLRTYHDLSRYFRDDVVASARVVYAA
jgi:predicted nucleotidyltransferase